MHGSDRDPLDLTKPLLKVAAYCSTTFDSPIHLSSYIYHHTPHNSNSSNKERFGRGNQHTKLSYLNTNSVDIVHRPVVSGGENRGSTRVEITRKDKGADYYFHRELIPYLYIMSRVIEITPPTPTFSVTCGTSTGPIQLEFVQHWSPNGYQRIYNLFKDSYYNDQYLYRCVQNFLVQ